LKYDEEAPLEDIIGRQFTIDYERFGDKVTEELKPDGANINVTKENRQEFVDLYIEHFFDK
jgi:E3 ubiquitin-protein ligase NEDD4